jgi:hypothetical protein
MRGVLLILTTTSLFSSGCAALIARSGQDLWDLKTRTEVEAVLGNPTGKGEIDGITYEEYTTRRKIAEPPGPGYAMAYTMTLGLGDLVFVPYELLLIGRRTIVGQEFHVAFDAEGNVVSLRRGKQPLGSPRPIETSEEGK